MGVSGLRKTYGERTAVDGVDLRVVTGRSLPSSDPTGPARRRPWRSSRATEPATAGTQFQQQELAGTWEFGRTTLVLARWSLAAAFLALRYFRWQRREES